MSRGGITVAKVRPIPYNENIMAGRPTIFNREVFDDICTRLASGQTLRAICREPGMPSRSAVRLWVLEDREPGIAIQYARAYELGLEEMADETIDIVDNGTNDWVPRGNRDGTVEMVLNREHIERSKLRVQQRNWIVARRLKGYSGRQSDEEVGDAGVTITGGLPDADN